MFDVIIVGAGIIGSLIAHTLSKYELKIAIVDQENDVATHQSMANSGIIHSGHEPKEKSLKARLNLEGALMWESLSKELRIDYKQIGALVISKNDEERIVLNQLVQQSKDRGILHQKLSRLEALKLEPNLNPDIKEALLLPTTAIITPWEACIAACECAVDNGVELYLNFEVEKIDFLNEEFIVESHDISLKSKLVINAAGLFADKIHALLDPQQNISLKAKKGEYFVLDRMDQTIVSRIIYPIPSALGKGVLVTPTIHKNVLLGPNAEWMNTKDDTSTSNKGLSYVKENVMKSIKNIPFTQVIRSFTGLRASHDWYDFIIDESPYQERFINLMGIDSPGLSAAPAIAKYVLEQFISKHFSLVRKETHLLRRPWMRLQEVEKTVRNDFIKEDPSFGNIICRCETISEKEIIDVIHRNVGAKSINGVKRRTRAGAGRCQGSFCEPRIVAILARELNLNEDEIVLERLDSYLFTKNDVETRNA
jgi:glycerol-3-phosphate dehydrogenase